MTQITITQVRNAQSMNIANTVIDVEINHPVHGWIPYLLTDYDDDTTIDNDAVVALIGSDFVAHVPPTQDELDTQLALEARVERDRMLVEDVDPIVTNPLRWEGLTADEKAAWTTYRADLLSVPQQAGFPNTINWPIKP